MSARLLALSLILTLSACGGGESAPTGPEPEPEPDPGEVDASGGTVTTPDGAVTLNIPAGAVAGAVTVTVQPNTTPPADPNVIGGTVYDFGPSGTQFNQPVRLTLDYDEAQLPAGLPEEQLRIVKLIEDRWVPIAENVTVDASNDRVSGDIRSFSTVGIGADPCWLQPLENATSATIETTDCPYPEAADGTRERYEDFYRVDVDSLKTALGIPGTRGMQLRLTSSTLGMRMGVQEAADEIFDGEVVSYLSTDPGSTASDVRLHIHANTGVFQIFVGPEGPDDVGAYELEVLLDDATNWSPTYGSPTFVGEGPFTFSGVIDADNALDVSGQFGDNDGIFVQRHLAFFEEGRQYRIRLSNVATTEGAPDDIWLFASLPGGVNRELDFGAGPGDGEREIVFQADASGGARIQIESSRSVAGQYDFLFEKIEDYDACAPKDLDFYKEATLSASDCLVEGETAARYMDMYRFSPVDLAAASGTSTSAPVRIDVLPVNADFAGQVGVRRPDGLVLGAREITAVDSDRRHLETLSSSGEAFELYVRGEDESALGAYDLNLTASPVGDYRCDTHFLLGDGGFDGVLRSSNSCEGVINFGPFVGDPLRYHYAYARLEAGTSYELSVTGYDPNGPFGFFTSGLSESESEVLLLPEGRSTLTRTVTPTVDGYWYVEMSAGGANPPTTSYTFELRTIG